MTEAHARVLREYALADDAGELNEARRRARGTAFELDESAEQDRAFEDRCLELNVHEAEKTKRAKRLGAR